MYDFFHVILIFVTAALITFNLMRASYLFFLHPPSKKGRHLEHARKRSLLFISIVNKLHYSYYDLLFDFAYLIRFSLKNSPLFLVGSFLFTSLVVLFALMPVALVTVTGFTLCVRSCQVIWAFLLNKDLLIRFNYSHSDVFRSFSWRFVIKNIFFHSPVAWADVTFYNILAWKNGKVDFATLDLIFFSRIIGFPIWYLKLVFMWTWTLIDISASEQFARKRLKAYPRVFLSLLKQVVFANLFEKNFFFFSVLHGHLIEVKDRKLRLNPEKALKTIYNFAIHQEQIFTYLRINQLTLGGQPHLFVSWDPEGSEGFSYTTKEVFQLKDSDTGEEKRVMTMFSPSGNFHNQRLLYTKICLQTALQPWTIKHTLFQSFGFSNYEVFAGFLLRNLALQYIIKQDHLVLQGDISKKIDLSEKFSLKSISKAYQGVNGEGGEAHLASLLQNGDEGHVIFEKICTQHEIELDLALSPQVRLDAVNSLMSYDDASLYRVLRSNLGWDGILLMDEVFKNLHEDLKEEKRGVGGWWF